MTQSISRSILDTILEHKREVEVPQRKREVPLRQMRRAAESVAYPTCDFARALRRDDGCVALIAEVKRASPSKGELAKGEFKPIELAQTYEANGASAISVLTDERFFKGALDHLRQVKQAVSLPMLRKDFIVDPYQLYEARAAGADAALLIVAALDDATLRDLHSLACELGLTPLVEVHDEAETERAIKISAQVIGVNNRDLRTFVTDIETTARCAAKFKVRSEKLEVADNLSLLTSSRDPGSLKALPSPIPFLVPRIGTGITGEAGSGHFSLVSESGIFTPHDVARVAAMGAQAVLVGESIITSSDTAGQVRALSQVKRLVV